MYHIFLYKSDYCFKMCFQQFRCIVRHKMYKIAPIQIVKNCIVIKGELQKLIVICINIFYTFEQQKYT